MELFSNLLPPSGRQRSFYVQLLVLFGCGFPLVLPATFKLGFLPALGGHSGHESRSKYHVGAFIDALQYVNKEILSNVMGENHTLNYTYIDNRGSTLESIRAMTEMYNDNVSAFIGPEDTCVVEARIAAAWNLPMVNFVSTLFYFLGPKRIYKA